VIYWNEIEPYAAAWLRNLIAAGHLPPGEVDTRSIVDVQPDDLRGFTQCHFFAGIGGWSLAAHLAGWPTSRPLWTGSCPCQPFSVAGRGAGAADERHLWPEYLRLIAARRPAVVMGEQVASPLGLSWVDLVSADLDDQGYSCWAADTCAAGVGAPHIRSRLWWVADPKSRGCREQRRQMEPREGGVRHPNSRGEPGGFWADADLLDFKDGKPRPVEAGTFPMADGLPTRMGRLRAYGNAIVPQIGAEVIAAYMECRP
jgi:DNA (cytosine-5)-methyltransferase 1